MTTFNFSINGKNFTGQLEKIEGPSNVRYKASARCPFCGKTYEVGKNPGKNKNEARARTDLVDSMKKHVSGKHE